MQIYEFSLKFNELDYISALIGTKQQLAVIEAYVYYLYNYIERVTEKSIGGF